MGTADRAVLALFFSVALAGCAAAPASCPAGTSAMKEAQLFFGRAIPGGGAVSEADWQRFLDEEITPRFPGGLTVQDASGQWKGSTGIVREDSKRLTVVITGKPGDGARLDAIRAAYRQRFRQDSVLLIETNVCGGF